MERGTWIVLALCGVTIAVTTALIMANQPMRSASGETLAPAEEARLALFHEITPVKLTNCELQRFGEQYDGGYLLCGNLLGNVRAAYSYGISGYDGWGCDVSRALGVTVHQYDCFNLTRPVCDGGSTIFHGECIGTAKETQDGRPFDTLEGQVAGNGDGGKHLVVKMDVEGAEWESFLQMPVAVLQRIDQLAVEFHGFDEPRHREAIARLKQYFHIAHLHWNNYSCVQGKSPFPAWAYEILFVNKRLGVVDPSEKVRLPHALDAPNNAMARDCQVSRRARRTW